MINNIDLTSSGTPSPRKQEIPMTKDQMLETLEQNENLLESALQLLAPLKAEADQVLAQIESNSSKRFESEKGL